MSDAQKGQELLALKGHTDTVTSVAWSPDGRTLAVAGTGGGVKLWDVPTGQQRASLPGHRGGACHVAFAGDGGMLFSASVAGEGRMWYARE